jgi:hypothetical protein
MKTSRARGGRGRQEVLAFPGKEGWVGRKEENE